MVVLHYQNQRLKIYFIQLIILIIPNFHPIIYYVLSIIEIK